MPGDFRRDRGDYARVVLVLPTRDCGCNGHPEFPTPSSGATICQISGALRCEDAKPCLINTSAKRLQSSSPAHAGDPVFQRRRLWNREAVAYWIPPTCAGYDDRKMGSSCQNALLKNRESFNPYRHGNSTA